MMLDDFARNMLAMKCCRALYAHLADKYSQDQCRKAFVDAMNAKSKLWGLNHTKWINPSGLGEDGNYSSSTARDLALLGLYAMQYPQMREIWRHDKVYAMHITKPYLIHYKKHIIRYIASTVESDMIGGVFPVVGAKTGAGDGYFTLLAICKMPDREGFVSVAIMQADSLEKRFDAIEETLYAIMGGGGRKKITSAKNACAYYKSPDGTISCVYEQNADEQSAPMSVTKVMTCCICLDYEKNFYRLIRIRPYDMIGTEGTSGNVFKEWEKVSLLDTMCAAMLPSSNQAANAIAREIGRIILVKNGDLKK